MKEYAYELKMKVRDYECDLEGIVNSRRASALPR